jgi:glycosyltransferase involved in cell wall biosynthesis
MKIVLATGLYPPEIGGPATYALMLESELPSRDIEVTTVPFGWVRKYPKVVRHFVYAWKLWRAARQADIVYALDPISVGFPALCIAKLTKKPFLIRLGGDYAWEQGRVRFGVTQTLDEYIVDMKKAPWQVRLFARLQTYVVSRATQVIVPSKYLKSIVQKWGIADEKIAVVYSALYPLEVNSSRDTLRSQLEYSYPTLVSAARLVPWKGFRVLIEVVDSLKERFPDISLVIIGDGDQRTVLERQVAKKGLSEHVRFTGRISKDALGASLKAADVFVLNTAYEGLSHQIIEVMDLGVPIVTTKSGGNPELITNGVNGYLVDFNDATQLEESIIRVLSHPESRERMTQSARLRSKDFQKNIVVEGVVSVLKNIHGAK